MLGNHERRPYIRSIFVGVGFPNPLGEDQLTG